MKHRISWLRLVGCISISSLFCAFCIPNIAAHAASPTIVLGEIAWAGSSRSTADEWVELWNLGETDLSIGNWSLGGAADADKKIILPADAIIPAHGTYLISNYANNDAKSTLAIAPNVVTTTIALSNSTLHVVLQDASGTAIDDTGTSTIPAAGSSLPIKSSMVRDMQSQSWKNASQAIHLIGDISDLATPGYCDGCILLPPEQIPKPDTEIPAEQTTSTDQQEPTAEPVDQQITKATSTASSIPIDEAAISTTILKTTTQTPTPAQTSSEDIPAPKPAYGMLRINEFMPAPSSGKEWVEIVSLDKGGSISLASCSLHDATGKIFTFTNEHLLDPQGNNHLLIELSSARLNNDGDTLGLYNPNGQLIDAISYTQSEKGYSYIRYPDTDGDWETTREPTPGTANQRELPEEEHPPTENAPAANVAPPQPPTPPIVIGASTPTSSAPPVIAAAKTAVIKNVPQTQSPPTPKPTATLKTPTEKKPKENPPKATKTPKLATPKTTKPKTSKKKIPPTYPLTEDMLSQDIEGGMRVSVFGIVVSPPGIINAHAFILMNPDGRGLRINLPKKLQLPPQGSSVNIVGKLEFDNQNIPRITVGTNDPFTILKKPLESPRIKSIDLLTVTAENAWSYVQTTGTVISATNKTITLDANGVQATVSLRAPVSYRGSRLDKGDFIQVDGLLDLTSDDPRLIPTTNEGILLLKRSEKPKTASGEISNALPQYPTWMPFGAAAGMVVVTEGAKRFKRQRDLKRLEAKLSSL